VCAEGCQRRLIEAGRRNQSMINILNDIIDQILILINFDVLKEFREVDVI